MLRNQRLDLPNQKLRLQGYPGLALSLHSSVHRCLNPRIQQTILMYLRRMASHDTSQMVDKQGHHMLRFRHQMNLCATNQNNIPNLRKNLQNQRPHYQNPNNQNDHNLWHKMAGLSLQLCCLKSFLFVIN